MPGGTGRCERGGVAHVVPVDRWSLARDALRIASGRFRALLTGGGDPAAMATELATDRWTVADCAAHVLVIASLYVDMVRDGAPATRIPGLDDLIATATVDSVADLNGYALEHFAERDPYRLAARLGEAVQVILDATEDTAPERTVTWLGGSRVPVAGLLAHLVNELLVHGWDIARAVHRDWPIPDAHAALYWELFFLGMLRHDYGLLLDASVSTLPHPIAVQFRSAYTPTATIVLADGRVSLAPPGHPYDARVRFRPARFNLMLFGRTGTVTAALRRDIVVSGPRPWRLPAFLRVVHMPNPRFARSTRRTGR